MRSSVRYKLHGTYSTPRYRHGQRVRCQRFGAVKIVGTSTGRIPWPLGKRLRTMAHVIYGDLARAVRREAPNSVAYWWGVSPTSVWRWRKALGVAKKMNAGSKLLRAECGRELSVLKSGKSRAPETIAKMRVAATGKRHTDTTRLKMRAAAQGRRPPWINPTWTRAEERLLTKLPALEVSRRTGRSLQAVYVRRHELGLPDGRRRNGN